MIADLAVWCFEGGLWERYSSYHGFHVLAYMNVAQNLRGVIVRLEVTNFASRHETCSPNSEGTTSEEDPCQNIFHPCNESIEFKFLFRKLS